MVVSTSQQVALAFTAVLFTFVVLPRLFGVGGGTAANDARYEPRYTRKGPGPGGVRGQPANAPGSHQTPENLQQMKQRLEQQLQGDKFKASSNKGYVFTLMPLYAIGVGVFAAYKFLKIKSADEKTQKEKFTKGAKKSMEAEQQLNELEQRLAQTERMLNSILTQLDPLTNCVKSVAQDQKKEIMTQLQTIRYLMKKRGMDCPPLSLTDASCERNLDDLIESLGTNDSSAAEEPPSAETPAAPEKVEDEVKGHEVKGHEDPEEEEEGADEAEEDEDPEEEEEDGGPEDGDSGDRNVEEVGAERPPSGLRRRNRPQ